MVFLDTIPPPESVGAALGGRAKVAIDVLECGHVIGAVLLAGRKDRPYRRIDDVRYRRCHECDRVSKVEAAPESASGDALE